MRSAGLRLPGVLAGCPARVAPGPSGDRPAGGAPALLGAVCCLRSGSGVPGELPLSRSPGQFRTSSTSRRSCQASGWATSPRCQRAPVFSATSGKTTPGAAAAAAEGDGVSRATAALADFGAERPGPGDHAANALGRAVGGLANRLEQQPSVGGPTLETGAVAVRESCRRRDEASPAGHRFTLPAASVVCWCQHTRAAGVPAHSERTGAQSRPQPFRCLRETTQWL